MTELSGRAKILLGVILLALVLYFVVRNCDQEPIHNEGMLTQEYNNDIKVSNVNNESEFIPEDLESKHSTNNNSTTRTDTERDKFNRKMTTRNSAKSDEYKYSNYNDGKRYSRSSDVEKFFEGNHPNDEGAGKGFAPIIENEGKYAAYLSERGNKKLSEKDKFDPVSLLPKEKNGEWFDDPYETTNIKSSHLINIYRPVGVNTISTTLKNASRDLRGSPPNPKYPVAPWNNSSYEPDTNIRNQALCY